MTDTEMQLLRRYSRCLADGSRKSPRGPYRHAYTEEQFERRIKDEASLPLLDEVCPSPPVIEEDLKRAQSLELLESAGLSIRQTKVCRLRLEGLTAPEIADAIGISERRVRGIFQEVREIFSLRLHHYGTLESAGMEDGYGWQEVFLSSQRRKGS